MTGQDQVWQRRIRLGPLLFGTVISLAISLIVVAVAPGGVAETDPSTALVSAAWGVGLIAAVLGIRIWVLGEAHLMPAAVGFAITTVLLVASEHYLNGLVGTAGAADAMRAMMGTGLSSGLGSGSEPGSILGGMSAAELQELARSPMAAAFLGGAGGATMPDLAQVSNGVELGLLAIASPGIMVLLGLLHRRLVWPGLASLALLAVVLHQTVQPTLDPASRDRLTAVLVAIMLITAAAAVSWLRRAGSGPGDAEGWVGTALVVFAGLIGVAALDSRSGGGTILSPSGLAMAGALMGGGQLFSFASTLAHRQDVERSLRQRIAETLIKGYETPEVDPLHVEVIDRVLRDGLVTTVLQPVVNLVDGSIVGFESLARFDGISPDQAFAAASAVGRSVALELLAASAALSRLSDIPEAHLAINMGPLAITDPSFLALIESFGTADRIVVELTEHHEVADRALVLESFRRLRAAGARVALDDVGAGFAGLKLLAELSPDVVKLDRALVTGCCNDPVSVAVIEGLVTFAQRTGTLLVAEGVEDARTAALLRELGVGQAQGWHFGRPERPMPYQAVQTVASAKV